MTADTATATTNGSVPRERRALDAVVTRLTINQRLAS